MPKDKIEEAQEKQEAAIRAAILSEASAYEDMILTAGFKVFEKKVNEKLSIEMTSILNGSTSDEEALKSRHFARGLQNTIDMIYNTIDAAKQIRKEAEEDDEDEDKDA